MTTTNIIKAAPTLLCSLSQQIKNAGGPGFNCDVKVKKIEGSFSALYRFETSEGEKVLKTPNTFQVGMIDDEENHFVMFDADANEYNLVTPRDIKKGPKRILLIKSLGESFQEMKEALKEIWPNRIVWKLTDPATVL